MKEQIILHADAQYSALSDYLRKLGSRRMLLVCGKHCAALPVAQYLMMQSDPEIVHFSGFSPNPDYAEIAAGVALYRSAGCDAVCAVGGGSTMDTAKCIKLFAEMPDDRPYTEQTIVPNAISLLVVPTTAGSGSEATRYAVIYREGRKFSVTHESCIPDAVLFDPSVLGSLPLYQRKATAMDALCHAVESMWSVRSTHESMTLADEAIRQVTAHLQGYLDGIPAECEAMFAAANLAGRAINITATTAGHAMSYRLTSDYGIAHGHAAVLCTAVLFSQMARDLSGCCDQRGASHLSQALSRIAAAMGCADAKDAAGAFSALLTRLALAAPDAMTAAEIPALAASVNPERLANHPVALDADAIAALYAELLERRHA